MHKHENSPTVTAAIQDAAVQKRKYTNINGLISDGALARAISRTPATIDENGPLTLPGCLTSKAPEPFPPILTLKALDEVLGQLNRAKIIRKRRSLMNKLLDDKQFLNTLSEINLAVSLINNGFLVRLEEQFFDARDADILANHQGQNHFIEVTNLAPTEMADGFGQICQIDKTRRVVERTINKYQEKFEVPLTRGWTEKAWVAIDITKNDSENVDILGQSLFRNPQWKQEVSAEVRKECQGLAGVLMYRSDPRNVGVDIIAWLSTAESSQIK